MLSIIPITLAALLFGKWYGCAIGAITGLTEMLHSSIHPYDYYEKYFSLPVNSIVLFALLGFVLGILFACSYRFFAGNNSDEADKPKHRTTP